MLRCQVIDDTVGNTLAAASTLTADIRSNLNGGGGGNKVRVREPRLVLLQSTQPVGGRMKHLPLCRERFLATS